MNTVPSSVIGTKRGLSTQSRRIFGDTLAARVLAVALQSLVFASIHFAWGIGGVLLAGVMGAIWGTAYIVCGRNLWIVILAHSAGHIMLVVGLYLS